MIHGRNCIAGAWREGVGEIEDVDPSDIGDCIGRFAQAAPGVVDLAVAAAIATQSLARAIKFGRASRSGCVTVNLPTAGADDHSPFGGTRASSCAARELSGAAIEFYTQMKTSYRHAGPAR